MSLRNNGNKQNPSFPVLPHRFDQKNKVFKRARWDEKIMSYLKRTLLFFLGKEQRELRSLHQCLSF